MKIKYEQIIPDRVLDLFFSIKNKGNIAVHDNIGTFEDAKTILFAAFKVSKGINSFPEVSCKNCTPLFVRSAFTCGL